jgi:hypothetical protein
VSAAGPATSRPNGRALIVGQPAFRGGPSLTLQRRGYACTEVDEPYQAMVQLCKRPLFYSAIVLSLNSLYREELPIISTIKQRYHHIDIWLSDTDGRQAALAEAMRQGADGLFAEDELHRIAGGTHGAGTVQSALDAGKEGFATDASGEESVNSSAKTAGDSASGEKSADPLLTAEELRALLQDTPNPM